MYHTVLPATRHKWMRPALTQPVSWYSIYLPQRDGRLSWPRLPDNDRPGVEPAIFRSLVRRPNHYTTEPPVTSVMGKFGGSWRLVTGKSPTWIMLWGSHGEVLRFQTTATCRDGLKNPRDKSAVASGKRWNGEISDVRDKTWEVSDVTTIHGKSATSQTNQ